MAIVDDLAGFVVRARWEDLSSHVRREMKKRVLDSLGCAIGALNAQPTKAIRKVVDDLGGNGRCTLLGGGTSSPDRAAFYNSALVRYLDFNDSYLAPGETCHPSDNLGAVLAAAQFSGASGKELLTALAVAYQVQCRLSDEAPVRARGFDHATQGAYAVAAGVSHALSLDRERTANALAIAGTALNALRVTRTGALSNWKGLAYPHTAFAATHAAWLAMAGITGPREVFEGNKGFMESISGKFELAWENESLDRVQRTDIKKYNAEFHSQSAIEGLLELKSRNSISAADVDRIEVDIFDVAYNIIPGGEEGDKTRVATKEEADHSLQYLLAVALLDGQVMPAQLESGRIARSDVQALLRKVTVRPSELYSRLFPHQHACKVTVFLKAGGSLSIDKTDYEGFHTRPMSWSVAAAKFEALSRSVCDGPAMAAIVDAVDHLDEMSVADFCTVVSTPHVTTKGDQHG